MLPFLTLHNVNSGCEVHVFVRVRMCLYVLYLLDIDYQNTCHSTSKARTILER